MCNYCGCRALEPVAQLTAEHEDILNHRGEIRRAVARGAFEVAVAELRAAREILRVHDAVEELAVYPAMGRFDEFADNVGTLFDEHDDTDQVVDRALAAAESGVDPGRLDWPAVLAAFDVLAEHIDHEEHGLFPAAAVSLDPDDWERAAAVRAEHTRAPGGVGVGHGHSHGHEHSHDHHGHDHHAHGDGHVRSDQHA